MWVLVHECVGHVRKLSLVSNRSETASMHTYVMREAGMKLMYHVLQSYMHAYERTHTHTAMIFACIYFDLHHIIYIHTHLLHAHTHAINLAQV